MIHLVFFLYNNIFYLQVKIHLIEYPKIYGVSQDPNTGNYILVHDKNYEDFCAICDKIYAYIQYKWCKPCQII